MPWGISHTEIWGQSNWVSTSCLFGLFPSLLEMFFFPQVLAMSSRSWLSYSYQSRFHLTPLSYETLEFASGFASEQCPEGIVAISTNTLRWESPTAEAPWEAGTEPTLPWAWCVVIETFIGSGFQYLVAKFRCVGVLASVKTLGPCFHIWQCSSVSEM